MIVSSASSSGTSCSSVWSTIPAGIMIQMLRGFSSAFTKSASVLVAGGALRLKRLDRVRVHVVDDDVVAVVHQPADQVGPHPAEPDHAELHG